MVESGRIIHLEGSGYRPNPIRLETSVNKIMTYEEPVEKLIFFRLIKNAQMQGTRNPESGVATNKERHLTTPTSWSVGQRRT